MITASKMEFLVSSISQQSNMPGILKCGLVYSYLHLFSISGTRRCLPKHSKKHSSPLSSSCRHCPIFFNRYGLQIMPQYWENIYPLGFYFFGSFLREYRPSFKISKLLAFAILIASLNSLFSFAVSTFTSHNTYIHIIGDRNGIFMGAMACMIFLAFYQFNLKNDAGKETFKKISIRSLDIFLCSAVFDAWLYPLFLERFYINQSQFGLYYFVIVPLIFCICFTIASLKRYLFAFCEMILRKFGIDIALQAKSTSAQVITSQQKTDTSTATCS